jgi:hypothetical protein
MNFGTQWSDQMGACDQGTVEEILDCFYEHGGNFIDTANNYQFQESESWIGEWMQKRGVRDQMGLSTFPLRQFVIINHEPKSLLQNLPPTTVEGPMLPASWPTSPATEQRASMYLSAPA